MLIVLGAVSAALFLVGITIDVSWLVTVTKPLPVLAMLVAVIRWSEGTSARLVAVGLALSAVGDIVLEEPIALFVPGLVAFLLGHVAYIAAFIAESKQVMPSRAIVPVVYGIAALAVLAPGLDDMALPVAIYIVVICAMLWRSWVWASSSPSQASRLALLGAALFVASDTVLAINRFHTSVPASDYVIILLYWAGQLGITLSMLKRQQG